MRPRQAISTQAIPAPRGGNGRDKDSKTNSSIFLRQHTAASFIGENKLDNSSYRLTSLG